MIAIHLLTQHWPFTKLKNKSTQDTGVFPQLNRASERTKKRRFCIRRKENADSDYEGDGGAVGARLFPRDNDEHESDGDGQ